MATYKFVNSFDEQNTTNKVLLSYFQVCLFPNPKTNKYQIKRFIINENSEFAGVKNYFLSKSKHEKFLAFKKQNEYKLLSVYDLNGIDYPTQADISVLTSKMISNNIDYYGFAPF